MHLQNVLKADKLIELYGEESSFFDQPIHYYIPFTDADPDFELRLMVARVLKPCLECKICKLKNSSVRVIYKRVEKREGKQSLMYGSLYTYPTSYEVNRYNWAYICSTDCLDQFRAQILWNEIKKGSNQ